VDNHTGGPDEQGHLRTHPRTAVTMSRIAQGVASFAFAAAGTAGFVTTVVTFVVASIICTVGAVLVGEGHRILPTLRMGRVWAVAVVGFISMVLAATAYELASVAVVSFLLLLVPLFSGLLAPLYGERMTRNGVIGLSISVLGIIAFAQPSQDYQAEPLGLVAALLGGLGLAILWMMSRGLATMNDGLWALSATQMIGPALLGLLVITVNGSLHRLCGQHDLAAHGSAPAPGEHRSAAVADLRPGLHRDGDRDPQRGPRRSHLVRRNGHHIGSDHRHETFPWAMMSK
jgi:drug/metabolite transporter (DMT)-like permease